MAQRDDAHETFMLIDSTSGNRLEIQSPKGDRARYGFTAHACPAPTCGCYTVELVCTPLDEPEAVDPDSRRIVALDTLSECPHIRLRDDEGIDAPLSQLVASRLRPEHWRRLRVLLTHEKRRAMEDMDLDALEPIFPKAVTDDGAMLIYKQIFPFAEDLAFPVDGETWVADDLYCVQPDCDCTEAILCLFPVSMGDGPESDQLACRTRQTVYETAAVRFHIDTGSWEVDPDPPVSTATARKLMTALKKAFPNLAFVLAERHRQLRYLYWKFLGHSATPIPDPVVAVPKVGRNQPCPCGSGKKHKRCCGR